MKTKQPREFTPMRNRSDDNPDTVDRIRDEFLGLAIAIWAAGIVGGVFLIVLATLYATGGIG